MPTKESVTVKESDLGSAVFALTHFEPDEKIGEITGRVVEDPNYGSDYCMDCGEGQSIEAEAPFRFLNHSCEPNCELVLWKGEADWDWELCLHGIKAIQPGDELTIDYAWPVESAIPCLCRSATCRGWIVAEDDVAELQA